MPAPTTNDWNAFESVNRNVKADILYKYLCLGWTMTDVAEDIFGESDGRRVSCITRCYGLEGRNGGKFSNWGLEKSDFMDFVKSYPNGCNYDDGKTIVNFMNQRRSARQNQVKEQKEKQRRERERQERERRERERQERERRERERQERECQERERQERERRERERRERERWEQENLAWQSEIQQASYRYEPKDIEEIDYSRMTFQNNSNEGNSSYGGASYGSNDEDTIVAVRMMVPLLVALLIRWSINGTLFHNWFRSGITVFVGVIVLADIIFLLQDISTINGTVGKVGVIVFTILAVALATYTVCAYPGNWLKRIIAAVISFVIKIMAIGVAES